MRSLSLTRSSAAPRTVQVPPKVARAASAGSSSMSSGTSAGATTTSPSGPDSIRTAPTGSPCHVSSAVTSTRAPARRSTSNSAVRVGFNPTWRISMAEPGSPAAATPRNAHADGSPGTRSARPPVRRAPPSTVSRPATERSTVTPNAANARSVWSRVASGSTTVVVPDARSPASRTALLICALGTSGVWVIPVKRTAGDGERWPPALGGGEPGAHGGEWGDDASHRPARQRGVADEPRRERRSGQYAGQQPHRRPRVAAVDVGPGRAEPAGRRRRSAPASPPAPPACSTSIPSDSRQVRVERQSAPVE